MESVNLPKVSKIISSRPISEDAAFQMVSKFLEKEQRRLDPVVLHQSGHWGDVFLVCEALASTTKQSDSNIQAQLDRLRQSAPIAIKEEEYDESPPVAVGSSTRTPGHNQRRRRDMSAAVAVAPPAAVQSMAPMATYRPSPPLVKDEKQEQVQADEQPSSAQAVLKEAPVVETGDKEQQLAASKSNKRKAEKKAKKEKKKKRKHE